MLEALINPKRAEKKPWKMFFIGLIYATLSLLMVHWFFSGDQILSDYSGMMVVTFCVMFSLPFMYYIIKKEEKEDEREPVGGFFGVWRDHQDAIMSLMWLFLGFILAFSFWNIILQDFNLLNAQVGTYCMINNPGNIELCISQYTLPKKHMTGAATSGFHFLAIVENNLLVMISILVFSLVFGAGAIFILAWNASVIAAAVGIFTRYQLSEIPLGILRYMIHGFPEIAAYFTTALAGGIFGVGVIRNGIKTRKFLKVAENAAILVFISILLIVFAAVLEVYFTPFLFK